ncbi:MAG: hypothetical protein KGL52_13315 [Rhodospirillales bacterium]|nr:hypothetical protein [Rhodospirillales bacterium]
MLKVAAYCYEYSLFLAAGAMVAWTMLVARKHLVTRYRWFRLAPLALAGLTFGKVLFHPIVIVSPVSGTVFHPGEKVPVSVAIHPSFLTALFPAVNVDLPKCWTCKSSPAGIAVSGVLSGALDHFTIALPKDLAPGVLVTSAVAGMNGSMHPAMRSRYVELVVK